MNELRIVLTNDELCVLIGTFDQEIEGRTKMRYFDKGLATRKGVGWKALRSAYELAVDETRELQERVSLMQVEIADLRERLNKACNMAAKTIKE
jgi:hypothetical protein